MLIPVAERAKAGDWGRSVSEIDNSNSPGRGGLCEGLIPLPEESYRLWCVVVGMI
jgi:hypothetical protein